MNKIMVISSLCDNFRDFIEYRYPPLRGVADLNFEINGSPPLFIEVDGKQITHPRNNYERNLWEENYAYTLWADRRKLMYIRPVTKTVRFYRLNLEALLGRYIASQVYKYLLVNFSEYKLEDKDERF